MTWFDDLIAYIAFLAAGILILSSVAAIGFSLAGFDLSAWKSVYVSVAGGSLLTFIGAVIISEI